MMRRLFFDANVLFTAAHNPNGKAALVITLGKNGLWQLATSPYAKEEAQRNLARKYPQFINHFEDNIGCFLLVNDRIDIPCPTSLPEKDRPIYRAAHACRANVLLTGDLRDFGALMNQPQLTSGLLIQTVAQYLCSL
jgi:predicted nucleic acid-binding protein